MFSLIKTPGWVERIFKNYTWAINSEDKALYLTFDDGPQPGITDWVLDQLKAYEAKATFFCVGNNVKNFPDLYRRILSEGHTVGNHTFHHLNGWRTSDAAYLKDIELAAEYIDSKLFRPPYGKITGFQRKQLASLKYNMQTIMWSVLSKDYDQKISGEKCLENVILNSKPGSIIVFHDSVKAEDRLRIALPGTLKYFADKGFAFKSIAI